MANIRNLSKLAGTAKKLAGKHNDKIDKAIDKGVAAADKATKGKYGDKLSGSAVKLKGAVDKVADTPMGSPGAPAGTTSTTARPHSEATATGAVPDPDAPKGAH